MLKDLPVKIVTLMDFPEIGPVLEDGNTYHENASKKALTFARHTGIVTIADDSGLEVDALGGRPGVHSSRFAGDDATDKENIDKLLRLMAGVEREKRGARFVCVIALARPSGEVDFIEGELYGEIGFERAGENGFGYDPVFIMPDSGRSLAQMGNEEKNRISHRGKAMTKVRELLADTHGYLPASNASVEGEAPSGFCRWRGRREPL
ncbi:MAG: RdgB/HAM1 family non-canonical purine NTP pyrophosphatase [Nitrospirota bacterium]